MPNEFADLHGNLSPPEHSFALGQGQVRSLNVHRQNVCSCVLNKVSEPVLELLDTAVCRARSFRENEERSALFQKLECVLQRDVGVQ